ncbi:hypothetical protein XENOCAPTIV_020116, partial [Xenoophorus captivus]
SVSAHYAPHLCPTSSALSLQTELLIHTGAMENVFLEVMIKHGRFPNNTTNRISYCYW